MDGWDEAEMADDTGGEGSSWTNGVGIREGFATLGAADLERLKRPSYTFQRWSVGVWTGNIRQVRTLNGAPRHPAPTTKRIQHHRELSCWTFRHLAVTIERKTLVGRSTGLSYDRALASTTSASLMKSVAAEVVIVGQVGDTESSTTINSCVRRRRLLRNAVHLLVK